MVFWYIQMTDDAQKILIVGAGFSGATVAHLLATSGFYCVVVDERQHVAGNCHTAVDAETGILLHRYGPHIFHTDDDEVWNFVTAHGAFLPYQHRVYTKSDGKIYRLPINLHTINQFFGTSLGPNEAKHFIEQKCLSIAEPRNFAEQAMSTVGPELYAAFLEGYTHKQWGVTPEELPASILKRLPLRFTFNDNYFHHVRQALPINGYTSIVESLLKHPNIELRLNAKWQLPSTAETFRHIFYTGPLDQYFAHRAGRLKYRTLDFEEVRTMKDYQGTAVINYADRNVAWTRATEHKYLSPRQPVENGPSVSYLEKARDCMPNDIPYYPLHMANDRAMLRNYVEMANAIKGVTFLGRLGSYAYLDMDGAIKRAMEVARHAVTAFRTSQPLQSFVHPPA